MDILSWIFFGLIAGSIARLLMPGKTEPKGCLSTIILGIVGRIGRRFFRQQVFGYRPCGRLELWQLCHCRQWSRINTLGLCHDSKKGLTYFFSY